MKLKKTAIKIITTGTWKKKKYTAKKAKITHAKLKWTNTVSRFFSTFFKKINADKRGIKKIKDLLYSKLEIIGKKIPPLTKK